MTQEEIIEFLLKAKRHTYAAAGGASSPSPFSGSRLLEYKDKDYTYRDIYYGSRFFIGHEILWKSEKPVWGMNYSGGVIKNEPSIELSDIYRFLQAALLRGDKEHPHRGPASFREGAFQYENFVKGNFTLFHGEETILVESRPVYRLNYHGGEIL